MKTTNAALLSFAAIHSCAQAKNIRGVPDKLVLTENSDGFVDNLPINKDFSVSTNDECPIVPDGVPIGYDWNPQVCSVDDVSCDYPNTSSATAAGLDINDCTCDEYADIEALLREKFNDNCTLLLEGNFDEIWTVECKDEADTTVTLVKQDGLVRTLKIETGGSEMPSDDGTYLGSALSEIKFQNQCTDLSDAIDFLDGLELVMPFTCPFEFPDWQSVSPGDLEYDPQLCSVGDNLCPYDSPAYVTAAGIDVNDCTCDEYAAIVELLHNTFGFDNCHQTSPRPANPEDAQIWHICYDDEMTGVKFVAKGGTLNSPPIPSTLESTSELKESKPIVFDNLCSDLTDAEDYLNGLDLVLPSVCPVLPLGVNFPMIHAPVQCVHPNDSSVVCEYSNQSMASAVGFNPSVCEPSSGGDW